jgi:hypothetical protein
MPQPPRINVLVTHTDPVMAAGRVATLKKGPGFKVMVRSPEPIVAQSVDSQCTSADVIVADYDSGLRLAASKHAGRDRFSF